MNTVKSKQRNGLFNLESLEPQLCLFIPNFAFFENNPNLEVRPEIVGELRLKEATSEILPQKGYSSQSKPRCQSPSLLTTSEKDSYHSLKQEVDNALFSSSKRSISNDHHLRLKSGSINHQSIVEMLQGKISKQSEEIEQLKLGISSKEQFDITFSGQKGKKFIKFNLNFACFSKRSKRESKRRE